MGGSDPFWLFVNLAFFIGLGFTILICGLWELAKLAWSRRPGFIRNSDRRKAETIRRLQMLSAALRDDDLATTPWSMEGASK